MPKEKKKEKNSATVFYHSKLLDFTKGGEEILTAWSPNLRRALIVGQMQFSWDGFLLKITTSCVVYLYGT
jgi:hypothetical protein